MDLKDTLWQLFGRTGDIKYYLMLRDLEDAERGRKK